MNVSARFSDFQTPSLEPTYTQSSHAFDIDNLILLLFPIISPDELFIFSVISQISVDYFLTYKNFKSKTDALKHCQKLSFIKKCLIINPLN